MIDRLKQKAEDLGYEFCFAIDLPNGNVVLWFYSDQRGDATVTVNPADSTVLVNGQWVPA